jgi:hypothetical protein
MVHPRAFLDETPVASIGMNMRPEIVTLSLWLRKSPPGSQSLLGAVNIKELALARQRLGLRWPSTALFPRHFSKAPAAVAPRRRQGWRVPKPGGGSHGLWKVSTLEINRVRLGNMNQSDRGTLDSSGSAWDEERFCRINPAFRASGSWREPGQPGAFHPLNIHPQ